MPATCWGLEATRRYYSYQFPHTEQSVQPPTVYLFDRQNELFRWQHVSVYAIYAELSDLKFRRWINYQKHMVRGQFCNKDGWSWFIFWKQVVCNSGNMYNFVLDRAEYFVPLLFLQMYLLSVPTFSSPLLLIHTSTYCNVVFQEMIFWWMKKYKFYSVLHLLTSENLVMNRI